MGAYNLTPNTLVPPFIFRAAAAGSWCMCLGMIADTTILWPVRHHPVPRRVSMFGEPERLPWLRRTGRRHCYELRCPGRDARLLCQGALAHQTVEVSY